MNPKPTPSSVSRALPEVHLAALAHNFELEKFIRKPKERRDKYFRLIERVEEDMGNLLGHLPSDSDLRSVVGLALSRDRSFLAYAINNGGLEQVSTADGSADLILAGAGAILCEYLTANGKSSS